MSAADRFAPTPGSWSDVMGVHFTRVARDEVVAELTIGPQHRQVAGIVHGGVYAGLIETVASLGATLAAKGARIVGVENHTSFVRVAKDGVLRATAMPLHVGRSTQLWSVTIHHADAGSEHLAATGRVRLMSLG